MVIGVPWKRVWKHYQNWNRTAQGESSVVSYLVAHPEYLARLMRKKGVNVSKLELVGLESAFPKKRGESGKYRRADIIFRSENNFLVVEAKENDSRAAIGGATYYARLLRTHLR